jgi:glycosyltransferase involved in cell wall biosynthesis
MDKRLAVSVIIPTLNRCSYLGRAIASVREQTFPSSEYEIIVVDNGCTDGTRDLVERLNQDGGKRLCYVYEGQLGLHHARHAGARAAKSKILIFTDDDATFDPGWLQAYTTAFARYPEMAAAGGPVRPRWEVPPPQWLLEFIGDAKIFGYLSLMELYQEFRLDPKGIFFGVNMAIRRQVLFEVGGFNPDSFGDVWLGDGEAGLNRKLWERGTLIGYVPHSVVYHHIPAQRMTVEYLCRRMVNEGACTEYATFQKGTPGPISLYMRMIRLALSLVKLGPTSLGRIILKPDRFALLKARMGFAYHLSRLRYITRLLHDQAFRELVEQEHWLTEV